MSFVESVSKTAAKQNRMPGVYSYEMFGGDLNCYECTVRLTSRDNENSSRRFYRVNFYITESGKDEIMELTKSLGGEFTVY